MHTETAAHHAPATTYIHEIERWRAQRIEQLTAPDGWLTLIGLEWLQPGPNAIGAAEENDIVLSTGPAHLGVITLTSDGHAHMQLAPETGTRINGREVRETELIDDMHAGGPPTLVQFGTTSFSLIDRDGRTGVRVRDRNAATRTTFQGLNYFPIDARWRVEATWVPATTPRTLPIASTLGMVRERPVLGKAVFTWEGQPHELSAVGERTNHISFVMADETSGHETYGGARFLTPDTASDGRLFLDFNKATNPPCAFTPYATCPLAPPENRLRIAITAGEKTYRGGHH